jgi:hypothetical protein
MEYYERIAFLRAKVRITSFKEYVPGRHGELQAVVFAQLDGIEIYADLERQKLLYKEDKKEKSVRQRRRERIDDAQPETFGLEGDEAANTMEDTQPARLQKTPYARSPVPGEPPD